MTIQVDDTGVLVDPAGWQSLLVGDAEQATLERAHSVPGTREALAAARKPVALLEVQTLTPNGPREHMGWICEASVALLVDLGREEHRLMSFSPDHLPVALARLIGLGPRHQRASEVVGIDAVDLGATLAGESRTILDRLDADRAWSLVLGPVDGEDESTVLAAGLDGEGGCWLIETEEERLVARRTPPRQAWRVLAGLLTAVPLPAEDHDG